jgi:hypothetical protein
LDALPETEALLPDPSASEQLSISMASADEGEQSESEA